MTSFKKWLLTGLEDIAERSVSEKEAKTLMTLEDDSNDFLPNGQRLVLRSLGQAGRTKVHLLPIPQHDTSNVKHFTLLTDQSLTTTNTLDQLEILFCSISPLHLGQSSTIFSYNMDLSGNTSGSTRLICKSAAGDVIALPASTASSKHPFDPAPSAFSYLEFDVEKLAEFQFIAVVDKSSEPRDGWLIAEFASQSDTVLSSSKTLSELAMQGLDISTSNDRPLVMDMKIPNLQSSLLAYKLSLAASPCDDDIQLFSPLVRQYISEPYESKFFVNVKEAEISMHGVAPYLPPSLLKVGHGGRSEVEGLALQIWSDPTCNSTMEVKLEVDVVGSMGKLWMRYRTVFAAFPLVVVALVLRKQFKVYDDTGTSSLFLYQTTCDPS